MTTNRLTIDTADNQGLDPEGGKWVVICETHNTILNVRTKRDAKSSKGIDFCDDCREETN